MASPQHKYDDSDSEGDDFNPAPADMSDDEQQRDEPSSPVASKTDARRSSTHRRKRRRGRDARAAFFDVEAEVDEDDEEAEDEEDQAEIGDFIDPSHPDELAEAGDVDDERYHRELDRRKQMEDNVGVEEVAERLKRDYGRKNAYSGRGGLGDSTVIPKRLLLPSVNDPSIWAVKCREGKENEVVLAIMKLVEERMGSKDELPITSAFERGGPTSVMKGYIYVEAYHHNDVTKALEDVLNVYPNSKMFLIEIKDMPDLLRVQPPPRLTPGTWVRIKRPKVYEGDLGQVQDIMDTGLEAQVKIIPRIDYSPREEKPADKANGFDKDGKRKRPGFFAKARPPQRLFSDVEARKRNPGGLSGNPMTNTWMYKSENYVKGFLIKSIKLQHLVTTNVNPTLEEVTKFASSDEKDGAENLDLKALAASLKDSSANVAYLPGDIVEVFRGEQKGVVGKTTNVVGDIVTVAVTEGGLEGQTIEVPSSALRKRFRLGDHVKVTSASRYQDEVGMVVKISDDRVTFLTDQNNTEITVFSKDLREASDISGQGSLGQYALLDLVQLDMTTVGCIVKVDRDSLVVLDQNGSTRQVMPSQIANKIPRRKHTIAADRNGSEIRLDDVVKEYGGQQRQGKIIHIHRSFVYLHNNESSENAGVFVTRSSSLMTIAAKGGRVAAGPDLTQMNPALKRNPNANGNGGMAPPQKQMFGRDRSIGQTVTIKKGGWKGLLGIVKDTTDTHARVELHTKGKIVTVPKVDLVFKDKVTGRSIDINGRGGGFAGRGGFGGGRGGSDSGFGSRTPQVSSGSERTPAWGSSRVTARTPAWSQGPASGSRTPAWGDGSRTVNPYDGSRTAYGSGSRTPAWSSGAKTPAPDGFSLGSKTPAYGGSGGDSAWGAGSKTPAYGISAPTPGASNDPWGPTPAPYDAPTPGAGLGAPTPGAALNAPTPGAFNAPTPGALNAPTPGGWQGGWGADSAPTPAAAAPTPGASGGGYYSAPTPGAFAETPAASGPRYTDDD
ncbi:Transcription elongation factor spt5 [Cytospora mali]|uniref:Transcription elongation factor SPT5 n=1 Tax=Cytospora mali TaxID=578113 RepID=A0A194W1F4_CYTMA|nr:Transcription elongation factor spt5 [Valsa mali]